MSHGQIDAQASESISNAIARDFTALIITAYTEKQTGRVCNICAQILSGRERLGTEVRLGLGWSEVRESMLDAAIRHCWPNYVIKGA